MSRRLYLGRLPTNTRAEDVADFFVDAGKIVDTRVMTGFGFVEFENTADAESAVQKYNGKPFMDQTILIEFAKEGRPRRENNHDGDRAPREFGTRTRRPPGIRITVSGISRDTSWQDLKDFGRDAGSVSFADIDRDVQGQGILEYLSRDDAERAVKDLDGKELRGRTVRVALDEARGGPDNYRRGGDDRRGDRRDDRRDDRGPPRDYRDDRYDRPRERRERSRSPRRADYDDRRARSPPRRDDDRRPSGYEDLRRGGYDDRRPPDYYYDRRRDDRRDDRKHDRDPRDEDRAPRQSSGEGGWAR